MYLRVISRTERCMSVSLYLRPPNDLTCHVLQVLSYHASATEEETRELQVTAVN